MKKGFTLVELLAVIVILAVISFIAVPIVSNVINSGKVGAIESSTNFYIDELEKKFSEWIIEGIPSELIYDTDSAGYIKFDVKNLNSVLKFDGEKPISGYVKIDNNYSSDNYYFGYVMNAELKFDNGYTATYTYNIKGESKNSVTIDVVKK